LEIKASLKKISILLVPSVAFSAYYLYVGKFLEAVLTLGITAGFFCFFLYLAGKRAPRKIDYNLVTMIFHLYGLSHGQTSPADMVEAIAENKEYGFYSKVFQKIRKLAKDFGYGYTEATAQIAETVKTPLKDVLVRCTNVFSSGEPKGYLEIESSTLMEEYFSYYARAIETLYNDHLYGEPFRDLLWIRSRRLSRGDHVPPVQVNRPQRKHRVRW